MCHISISRPESLLSFKATQLPQRHIYPDVLYHPTSLYNKYIHGIPSVSGPAPAGIVSVNFITIHHFHRPERLKASLLYPLSYLVYKSFSEFCEFCLQNNVKLQYRIFAGLPECALQWLQNFSHAAVNSNLLKSQIWSWSV